MEEAGRGDVLFISGFGRRDSGGGRGTRRHKTVSTHRAVLQAVSPN